MCPEYLCQCIDLHGTRLSSRTLLEYSSDVCFDPPIHALECNVAFLLVQDLRLLWAIWQETYGADPNKNRRDTFDDEQQPPWRNRDRGMLDTEG